MSDNKKKSKFDLEFIAHDYQNICDIHLLGDKKESLKFKKSIDFDAIFTDDLIKDITEIVGNLKEEIHKKYPDRNVTENLLEEYFKDNNNNVDEINNIIGRISEKLNNKPLDNIYKKKFQDALKSKIMYGNSFVKFILGKLPENQSPTEEDSDFCVIENGDNTIVLPTEVKEKLKDKLKKKAKFQIIKCIFGNIRKAEENEEIYIGRSDVRKDEKITVVESGEITESSIINGVIGALTVIVPASEVSYDKEKIIISVSEENVKRCLEECFHDIYVEKNITHQDFIEKYAEYLEQSLEKDFRLKETINIPFFAQYTLAVGQLISKRELKINLRIESRFDAANNADEIKSYFAATLLSYGNIKDINVADVICDDNNLFDCLLVVLYAQNLLKANYKGPYRTYRQFESNDNRIRGAIDIARYIKLDIGQDNGRIACKYRENTVNNYLNILILKTYEYIKIKYPGITKRIIDNNPMLKGLLDMFRYEVDYQSVSLKTAISKNQKPISHPYYSEYELVRKVCLQLMRGEGKSIFESSEKTVNGFLYYLPDLWEEYLHSVFTEAFIGTDIKVNEQAEQGYVRRKETNISTYDSQNKLLKNNLYNEYLCVARPDFVLSKVIDNEEKTQLILDAKMKKDAYTFFEGGYVKNPERFRSDVDKCLRDMVVFGAEMGTGVVIPKEIEIVKNQLTTGDGNNSISYSSIEESYYVRQISNEYVTKKFYVLPFIVPASRDYKNYNSWRTAFDTSQEDFIREVLKKQVYDAEW